MQTFGKVYTKRQQFLFVFLQSKVLFQKFLQKTKKKFAKQTSWQIIDGICTKK
jgi:hypothetical protein